jgi:hypothetical protein
VREAKGENGNKDCDKTVADNSLAEINAAKVSRGVRNGYVIFHTSFFENLNDSED